MILSDLAKYSMTRSGISATAEGFLLLCYNRNITKYMLEEIANGSLEAITVYLQTEKCSCLGNAVPLSVCNQQEVKSLF